MKILTFNTGRAYTNDGQRIAAAQLDNGNIIMVDADRGLDMMFSSDFDFTERGIMHAYDWNICIYPSQVGMPYSEYNEIASKLREVAYTVKGGTK
jgi:hypothetical protein